MEFLKVFSENNIHYVFSGHFHQNRVTHSDQYKITNITTSAIGMQLGHEKSGFRIVKVHQDSLEHNYVEFENVPNEVKM